MKATIPVKSRFQGNYFSVKVQRLLAALFTDCLNSLQFSSLQLILTFDFLGGG